VYQNKKKRFYFGQNASFLVSNVAWRRSDKLGHLVLLLILGHVDANEMCFGFVAVQIASDLFGELGFAYLRI
jgi:hypothetical protein